MQALDRTAPILSLRPRQPERPHDYVRHGRTSLFAALDVATGAPDSNPQPTTPH
jgi:hypothetical protein